MCVVMMYNTPAYRVFEMPYIDNQLSMLKHFKSPFPLTLAIGNNLNCK